MESVSEAFGRFLSQPGRGHGTKAKYRYKFKLFLERYGEWPVNEVTTDIISDWFRFLEERKSYSDGHLAFHRACHRTFWRWLGMDIVHVGRYSEKPSVARAATDDEIRRLLETCRRMWSTIHDQRDAAIVAMGTCGLRRSNVRSIRTSEVRRSLANPITQSGRTYYTLQTKGKQPMTAVMDEQRAAILQRYLTSRPATRHDRLFINHNQYDEYYLDPLGNEGLIKARRRICTAAGLRLVSFQEMRRWLATKIAKAGNVQIAAQALGHKSGVHVVLNHYYNPDTEAVQTTILQAYGL